MEQHQRHLRNYFNEMEREAQKLQSLLDRATNPRPLENGETDANAANAKKSRKNPISKNSELTVGRVEVLQYNNDDSRRQHMKARGST